MSSIPTKDELNAETHEKKRHDYNEKLNDLFIELCKDLKMDLNSVLNLTAFHELVNHLNPGAKLPKKVPSPAPSTSAESYEPYKPDETLEEYLNRIDSQKKIPDEEEPQKVALDKPGLNISPCIICSLQIQTHQSVLLTINDATKVIMAAVLGGGIPREEAEKTILIHPLRMCTEHVDQVHEWMCKAVGANNVTEVECAPVGPLLDALQLYRRVKGIRDIHDGRVPANTALGSFKMALKSYFRNYVPRRKPANKKKVEPKEYVSLQELIKRAPINMPLRDYLREKNVILTAKDERTLLSSLQIPDDRFPPRRIQREPHPNALQTNYDPLASYIGEAITARSMMRSTFMVDERNARRPQSESYGVPSSSTSTAWIQEKPEPFHLPDVSTLLEPKPEEEVNYNKDFAPPDNAHEYDSDFVMEEIREQKPEVIEAKEPKEEPMW